LADHHDGASGPPPRVTVKIESLSDLVFGLALSIGSVILVGRAIPQTGNELAVNVLLFGFGFAILVLVWIGYSRSMAVLPVEVPGALLTNILLLFFVAIEPYLFYVLTSAGSPGLADAASVAYALDVCGMFIMQAVLAHLVVRESQLGLHGQHPLHPVVLTRFGRVAKADIIVAVVFAVSALPIFWIDTPVGYVRFYLWSSGFLVYIPAFASRRWRGNEPGSDADPP
jgi:uncharacterized membrane protein